YQRLGSGSPHVMAFLREYQDESVMVLINLRPDPIDSLLLAFNVGQPFPGVYPLYNLLEGQNGPEVNINAQGQFRDISLAGREVKMYRFLRVLSADSEIESDVLTLFPNPSQDRLSLKTSLPQARYSILDINGKRIQDGTWSQPGVHTINLSQLPSGHYHLQVISEDQSMVKRFVRK
ncbi:MAG: T9SS type A sorting domain-containing protein, partial [Bacteroidota bacterium]